MFNSEVRAIWLFFYLIYLDGERATQIASKAVDAFYENIKKTPQISPNIILIRATTEALKKSQAELSEGNIQSRLPKNLNYWHKLKNQLNEQDLLPLIWSQVLKISIKEIAEATKLSEGTITFRVSKGVERLGEILSLIKSSEADL